MTLTDSGQYSGKTALVVGAARSGIAAAGFLLTRGARVVLTDVRAAGELEPQLAPLRALQGSEPRLVLETGGHRPETFEKCDFVVTSPGVPLSLPHFDLCRSAGIPVMAEVDLASRHLKGKILGITGSNGKTTTTVLLAEILRAAGLRAFAAGNVGAPLIGFAADSCDGDYYATELSSFQLEGMRELKPFVGAILNLSPDHLDRHGSFDAYVAAKRRIFRNQEATDFGVLNFDDPRTACLAGKIPSTPVFFGLSGPVGTGAGIAGGRVRYRDGNRELDLFPVDAVRLRGQHNLSNVLAACCMAMLAGADPESAARAVQAFQGVEHRLEPVAVVGGVEYFNDSKATNVDSATKSLEALPGRIHLIAGGRDKGGDFGTLRALVEQKVRSLVLIGEAAGRIRESLAGSVEIREAADLEQAVSICAREAAPGDIVLLAPGCASFDMFENYEHRGRVFKEAVRRLRPGG